MPEWTLALGGSDHDFSAALALDSDIRVAVEQERLTRKKHSLSFWYESPVKQSIDYCLSAEDISLGDVAVVVSSDSIPSRVRQDLSGLKIREFPHHLCHAASAYMMLPHEAKAGVLVYDGFGSIRGPAAREPLRNLRETFTFLRFTKRGFEYIGRTAGLGYIEVDEFPICVTNSAGMLYEMVTALLGYDLMDSGKTMGLSSHGVPCYLDEFEKFVEYKDDPSDCFRCATDNPALSAMIQRILISDRDSFAVRADLAATVQAIVNKVVLRCERFFVGREIDYLCLSGGCALNTVANSHLIENSALGLPIVIPPHCGDAGLGLGALWLNRFSAHGTAPEFTFRGNRISPGLSRPGRIYTKDECRDAVRQFYPRLALDCSVRSPRDLARIIARGEIVGVLNGGSEIGPRALGGRSIIADPRTAMIREKINRIIKRREPFRPFAPIVLESRYDDYFIDPRYGDPFMLKVAHVRERCQREAPAVVHIDGTARVQVVTPDGDPFLIELLQAFFEETGVGVLLNTSFNRRGEPIVESPLDAIDAFLGMRLDGLYLEGEFYRAAEPMNPKT